MPLSGKDSECREGVVVATVCIKACIDKVAGGVGKAVDTAGGSACR